MQPLNQWKQIFENFEPFVGLDIHIGTNMYVRMYGNVYLSHKDISSTV
jgi:hypothetical protein